MVRINRKHIAALLLTQATIFMKAHAENEVHTTTHAATHHNNAAEPAPVVVIIEEVNWRDESKDKPFNFSAGVGLSAFYDFQEYGAKSKFAPSKWKKDETNPQLADLYTEAYLSISKEMHILKNPLTLNLLIEKEEGKTSLDLSNLYVESKWFRVGKAPGNFCTYLPTIFRYAAYQVAFIHDLGDGLSYTLAIEESQGSTVRPKEEETKEQIEVDITTKDGKDAKVKTTEYKPSEPKIFTSKRWPQVALAANMIYKKDWGNIQLSGLGTFVEYSYTTPSTLKNNYNNKFMYGAALSGEYIFSHNEEYVDKKATFAGAHVKYRDGLGGYHGEAGGLPEHINSNFCISSDGKKVIANLRSIGFGANMKHVWTKNLSSSVSSSLLLVLNDSKIEDVAAEKKYNNALVFKATPISFNIAKNFTLAPSYQLGIGNVMPKGGAKSSTIQRVGIDISYDF